MRKQKLATAAATLAFCGALGIATALAGCSPQASQAESESQATEATDASGEKTMQEWGEMYPLQYNSYATLNYKQVDFGAEDGLSLYEDKTERPHGHFATLAMEVGPLARDSEGDLLFTDNARFGVDSLEYNSETGQWYVDDSNWVEVINDAGYTKGCYACRSSKFDEAYEQEGAKVFGEPVDQEFADLLNGQLWDCAICHEGTPGDAPDATLTMFTQLSRDAFDSFDPEERACGQCHNTFNHRKFITDQESMDGFDPYKYGTDIDSLLQAELEDGIYDVDEDTGIKIGCFDEPELEMTQGSAMNELGVTCIDCHMPKVTDPETGETYTDHNASGSPLAREESLEYCLTCHTSQGIDSTDAMVDMVRGKQREAREAVAAAQARMDEAYELIKAAVEDGTVDEATLNQVRDEYTYVDAYLHISNGDSNGRVVHNNDKLNDYLARANKRLDGIMEALA